MDDSTKYLLDIIFLVVLVGLIIGAYYVFKNSIAGKVFGDVFGDIDGFLGWAGAQAKACVNDGVTSSGCTVGPWAIGAGILYAIFSLLGVLGIPGLLKSKLAKIAESSEATKDIVSTDNISNIIKDETAALEKDPVRSKMSDDAKKLDIQLHANKDLTDAVRTTLSGNDPTTGQDAVNAGRETQTSIKGGYSDVTNAEVEKNDANAEIPEDW
uniref:Uncharacterized protein n=1 Tax=viral metagenome TaxID=1070528 RepID=A0A6C0JRD1_9ZZZZ